MKKRILALALIITALLCSCNGAKPGEPQAENEKDLSSKYHIVIPDIILDDEESVTTIFKINTETGSYTYLCTDPVCKHNTDECISYHTNDIKRCGDDLYFLKHTGEDPNATSYLYRMDLKTGEKEILMTKNQGDDTIFPGNQYLPTDTCLFMTINVLDTDEELIKNGTVSMEDVKSHYELYRFDYDTKKTVMIGYAEDLTGYPSRLISPSRADETTVRWLAGTDFYVTDYDLNLIEKVSGRTDDTKHIRYCGEYKYYLEPNRNYTPNATYYDMYLVDTVTNEEKLIAEGINIQIVLLEEQDTIIYRKYHDDPTVLFTKDEAETLKRKGKDSVDHTNGNVYAMNLDGSNNRLLCHIEDPYLDHTTIEAFFNYVGLPACVNDTIIAELSHHYIGLKVDRDVEDPENIPGNGEYELITNVDTEWLGGYAIINIKTGEYKVVYPYGDPTMYATRDISAELKQK